MSTYHNRLHALLMLLCCLVPVAFVAAIYVLKVPVSSALGWGLALVCPLSMGAMMAFMQRHQEAEHSEHPHPIEGTAHQH